MLRPNTTFLTGRKGTGKSTVFQRAQHEIRKQKSSISAYVDIKTVYKSAVVDAEANQKIASAAGGLSEEGVQRILLYRSFTRAVFQDIQKELQSQVTGGFVAEFIEKRPTSAQRAETIERIDQLLQDGAFEPEFTDVTGHGNTFGQRGRTGQAWREASSIGICFPLEGRHPRAGRCRSVRDEGGRAHR